MVACGHILKNVMSYSYTRIKLLKKYTLEITRNHRNVLSHQLQSIFHSETTTSINSQVNLKMLWKQIKLT